MRASWFTSIRRQAGSWRRRFRFGPGASRCPSPIWPWGPAPASKLYAVGSLAGAVGSPVRVYIVDPVSGQAVAAPFPVAGLGRLREADGLALAPDGTLYVTGLGTTGSQPKLVIWQPDVTGNSSGQEEVVPLSHRIAGLDARPGAGGSGTVELLGARRLRRGAGLDRSGHGAESILPLDAPTHGVAGDIAFHPDPQSLALEGVHQESFEDCEDCAA